MLTPTYRPKKDEAKIKQDVLDYLENIMPSASTATGVIGGSALAYLANHQLTPGLNPIVATALGALGGGAIGHLLTTEKKEMQKIQNLNQAALQLLLRLKSQE